MKRFMLPVLILTPLVLVLASPGSQTAAADHTYVGTKSCRKCHIKEWRSWSETKMAKVFDVLKPGERAEQKEAAGLDPQKDYTTDATCLKCHTTGYGQPGGFVSLEETPDLVGVGCEMCHGAGGTYIQDGYMTLANKEYKKADLVAVGLISPPTEETCRTCHNEESPFVGPGYVFDFEQRKADGTHEKFDLKYSH